MPPTARGSGAGCSRLRCEVGSGSTCWSNIGPLIPGGVAVKVPRFWDLRPMALSDAKRQRLWLQKVRDTGGAQSRTDDRGLLGRLRGQGSAPRAGVSQGDDRGLTRTGGAGQLRPQTMPKPVDSSDGRADNQ